MIGRVAVFGPFSPALWSRAPPKAHERGRSRLHQQLRTSGRLAPTSTTAHERGRSRLHRRPCAGGGARATRDVGQEEAW